MLTLISFLLFAFSTSITPGPNYIMLMMSGLHFGVKRSMPHFWGICIGFSIMVFIVSLGLGEIFVRFPILMTILKIVGALYMLYLAWKILNFSKIKKSFAAKKPFTFWQIVLFQWVNPKAWMMVVGITSLFMITSSHLLNAAIYSTVYFLFCTPAAVVWLFLGKSVQKILANERHLKIFNRIMACAIVISVLMIVLE